MADTKVTALTALTGANSAPGDLLTLVDVSDTTMDAAGTNKSITRQELQTYGAGTLTTDVKVLDLSATWNASGVTFTGLKFNVTDTASAATSLLLDLQVGGTGKVQVTKTNSKTSSPGLLFGNLGTNTGNIAVYRISAGTGESGFFSSSDDLYWTQNSSVAKMVLKNSVGLQLPPSSYLGFGSTTDLLNTAAFDTLLYRDAAATLAQRNGTNAQTFRLYNTYTDASNYERLAITWGSNIVSIKPENAGTGSARVLYISGLPTSNPGAGILWNNAGTPAIGT